MAVTFEEAINAHVARQLITRRIEVGLTQRQVAATLGVTFQQYQKYEHGKNRIFAERLYLLAKTFNTKIEYFFEGFEHSNSVNAPISKSKFDPIESVLLARQFDAIPSPELKQAIRSMIWILKPGD